MSQQEFNWERVNQLQIPLSKGILISTRTLPAPTTQSLSLLLM